jgi:hypothetical protein
VWSETFNLSATSNMVKRGSSRSNSSSAVIGQLNSGSSVPPALQIFVGHVPVLHLPLAYNPDEHALPVLGELPAQQILVLLNAPPIEHDEAA